LWVQEAALRRLKTLTELLEPSRQSSAVERLYYPLRAEAAVVGECNGRRADLILLALEPEVVMEELVHTAMEVREEVAVVEPVVILAQEVLEKSQALVAAQQGQEAAVVVVGGAETQVAKGLAPVE
jgi:hypothetical protein